MVLSRLTNRPAQNPLRIENRIEKLQDEIRDLRNALRRLERQMATTPELSYETTDCEHWTELLKIHSYALKILETKQAQMGISFPVHETIEIETRMSRIEELEGLINKNCGSSS